MAGKRRYRRFARGRVGITMFETTDGDGNPTRKYVPSRSYTNEAGERKFTSEFYFDDLANLKAAISHAEQVAIQEGAGSFEGQIEATEEQQQAPATAQA